ncbi:MAG: DUF2007 domain-containing protein, partial [Bacteroidetes bacterium]|nr:DUF2007 domain-containing protein [Bacteroidota bacterium]
MLRTIRSYSLPIEAQIAKAKLESEGIPVFLADENTINMQWLYSNAMGGVRLQVPDPYVDQALTILSVDESEIVENQEGYDAILCEACGSKNTRIYQKGKRMALSQIKNDIIPVFICFFQLILEMCIL